MTCIVLCGGGGKTTLYEKYPDIFLDIDYFMWNSSKYISSLNKALQNKDINGIGEIYQDAMKNDEELSIDDIMTKIKDLNDMFKSGLISKEEFELLKSKLLKNN